MRILVVEDIKDIRNLFEAMKPTIEKECNISIEMVFASSGEDALDLAKDIDIQFVDLRMPGMGGQKYIEITDKHIHTVVMTGNTDTLPWCNHDVLRKPFAFKEVSECIKKLNHV